MSGVEASTAIVIGSGSAGLTVAQGLVGLGRRVVLVESGPIGGDCTNVGCIPSKTLLHQARSGGLTPWATVRAVRDGLEAEESDMVEGDADIEVVRGTARLTAADSVVVTAPDGTRTTVRAPNVVIASGSRPHAVGIDGLEDHRILTNESLFDLDATPGHLAVIGGGAVAVEMATAVRRLGGAVTVVEVADRLLPGEDAEVSAIVADGLRAAGISVSVGSSATSFDETTRTLRLVDGRTVEQVDRVLMAVGRRPRLDDLGLATIGVDHGPRGISTDTWGRTSVRGVWAVGDVTGATASTHGANAMARRVVQAIGLPWVPRIGAPPTVPGAVFGDPEVASVGLAPGEIERRWPGGAHLHLRVDLADTDRGLTDEITRGAVIVDVERLTGRILRASIVGPGAAEAIGIFTLAIDQGVSMHRLYRLVHPYPTFATAIGKVADEFTRRTLPSLPAEAAAWARNLPRRIRRRSE